MGSECGASETSVRVGECRQASGGRRKCGSGGAWEASMRLGELKVAIQAILSNSLSNAESVYSILDKSLSRNCLKSVKEGAFMTSLGS